jgi:alpha-glucoside transport system permease protein
MSMTTAVAALAFTVGVPAALVGYLWVVERVLRRAGRRVAARLRPWAWLAPALVLLGVFLLYPFVNTVLLSTRDAVSQRSVGWDNYAYVLGSAEVRDSLRNNVLWVALLTLGCLAVGLLVAVLTDKVRYESAAKAVVVMPTAISFVAGAIIWRFMFDYRPPGLPQTGTLNAALTAVGGQPVAWLVDTRTNNAALIGVGVWMTAGFATVVLSAAIKGIPHELVEAARVDGAGPLQVFRYIVLPGLRPTLVVVATLLAISALKAFDIVYVLTNGNFGTNVIANVMYKELFVSRDYGHASAIAVLLVVLMLPVLVLNLAGARRREVPR